ncbi:VOC family protein [Streptomyces tirandamycinicus]|uniref:VOC family protein n=1 Tax=Streptomyces tirandamycinicus TaxID=2174846 RepID=UPI000376B7CA
MSTRPGTPALADVTYTDLDATREFYAGLFGWEFDTRTDPTGRYVHALSAGEPVAALRAGTTDAPPFWTLYLTTADPGATAQAIKDGGGQVVHEGEAPGDAHVVVAADPTGAIVGCLRTDTDRPFVPGRVAAPVWAELHTRDGAAADGFYRGLFGYQQTQIGDGTAYDYTLWSLDGPVLGRLRQGEDVPAHVPPHWLVYFGADPAVGTDTLADRAVSLGGRLVKDPWDLPAGRAAVLADVSGAVFAVVDESRATR